MRPGSGGGKAGFEIRYWRWWAFILGLGGLACAPAPAPVPEPVPAPLSAAPTEVIAAASGTVIGEVERRLEYLDDLVPAGAEIEVLVDGLDWPEGPVWLGENEGLLFSDVPANRIYRWREDAGVSPWLEPSGYTDTHPRGGEPGSNGLILDSAGRLVLCQHGDRRVARYLGTWDDPAPSFETLASSYQGKRLNSPNDLVYDQQGNLYFTDPPYGLDGGAESPDRELDMQGVYRLAPGGEVELLVDNLTRPNGIALSPDGRVLYVANSDPEHAVWMAYDVLPDGVLTSGRVFLDATAWVEQRPGLPDGLVVDQAGNLFATGPGGVWVISPYGQHLGTLLTTQPTSNCTFGGDGRWLYMTADRYLLRIRLSTQGLGFGD